MKSAVKNFKWLLILFTFLMIITQFYSLYFKLPFDASMSNKKMGFFNIYIYYLSQSFSLWTPLIRFFCTQILLQVGLSIFVYLYSMRMCRFLNWQQHIISIGSLLWLNAQCSIFLWNWYLYPYSYYSLWLSTHSSSISTIFYMNLLVLTTIIFVISVTISLFSIIKQKPLVSLSTIITLLFLTSLNTFFNYLSSSTQVAHNSKPNIILVITDSLRPDLTANNKEKSPNLNNFMKSSVYFSNAFTTLGRSTPGLITLITGKYPKNNGARFNLIANDYLKLKGSLPEILKEQGYETLLTSDSLQFVNVNKNFGFDKIVSPSRGIYDFILTYTNDTPLSNLLVNTTLGKWLFPFNYANRSSYHSYQPESFVHLFKNGLKQHNPNKPLFLVVDLSLAHWPYVWAKQPQLDTLPERYENALQTLDVQFGAIENVLKKNRLLDNAIFVIVSDHGDSLGIPGDRVINEKNYIGQKNRLDYITRYPYSTKLKNPELIGMDTSTGHGTDLLSMAQLNTTLAFKFYGSHFIPKAVSERVALIDITPTLLDLLHLPQTPADGVSLKPIIFSQESKNVFNRPIFIESEIEIPLVDLTKSNKSQSAMKHLISRYANLYSIDLKSHALVLKADATQQLLREKQRGIIEDDWLLVHFPGINNTQSYVINDSEESINKCYYAFPVETKLNKPKKFICYQSNPTKPYNVLVNLKSKQWQVLFKDETKNHPVFEKLLVELKNFYGDELKED